MPLETPGESNEVLRPRFGTGDPDVVADVLSYLIHSQMWPILPHDQGGTRCDFTTPVVIDELTRRIFESPN